MPTSVLLVYVAVSVIWGSTWSVIRVGLDDLPPLLFAGLRMALAAALLAPSHGAVVFAPHSRMRVVPEVVAERGGTAARFTGTVTSTCGSVTSTKTVIAPQ